MKTFLFAAASLLSITSTSAAPAAEAALDAAPLQSRAFNLWNPGYKPFKYKFYAPGKPFHEKYLCSKPGNPGEPYHLGYQSSSQSDYEFYLHPGDGDDYYGHKKYSDDDSRKKEDDDDDKDNDKDNDKDDDKDDDDDDKDDKNDDDDHRKYDDDETCLAGPDGYQSIYPIKNPEAYPFPPAWGRRLFRQLFITPPFEKVKVKNIPPGFFNKKKHFFQPPRGYKFICFEDGKGGFDVKGADKYDDCEIEVEAEYHKW